MSLNKANVLLKRFRLFGVIICVFLNYFTVLLTIGIMVNPFVAIGILLLTVSLCLYYTMKLYDVLSENL